MQPWRAGVTKIESFMIMGLYMAKGSTVKSPHAVFYTAVYGLLGAIVIASGQDNFGHVCVLAYLR
jgi:hypothetical protein